MKLKGSMIFWELSEIQTTKDELAALGFSEFVPRNDFKAALIKALKVVTKGNEKLYRRHSGYEGGLREERAKDVRARNPIRLVEEAVRGMLPKTTLGDAMYRKLKVYAGPDHPHAAQKPTKLEVA